jgi:DNA repair exonuclease SbcCD nuclease subunit
MKKLTKLTKKTNDLKLAAVLTADWHLATCVWKHRPQITGDAVFGLEQVVEYSHSLPILIAGDVFDSRHPALDVLGRVRYELGMSQGAYILGNHDRIETLDGESWLDIVVDSRDDDNWLRLSSERTTYHMADNPPCSDDPRIVSPDICEPMENIEVYGIDYTDTREQLQAKLDQLALSDDRRDSLRVLLLHQTYDKFFGFGKAELFDGMIPDGIDIVVCGHIHKSAIAKIETVGGKSIPFVSPGGTHITSISDSRNKSLYYLCNDGSILEKSLLTRRVIGMDISGSTEADIREAAMKLADRLPTATERPVELETPIVEVRYDSNTAENFRTILETALTANNGKAHFFWKDKTNITAEAKIEKPVDERADVSIETGLTYARDVLYNNESDERVIGIVEGLLTSDPDTERYELLKKSFLQTK